MSRFEKGNIPWNKGLKRPEISGENHYLYGKHPSEATLKRMSDARKGKHLTEEHKRKIAENSGMRGKHHSEASKQRISDANKGKAPWHKGQHLSEEHRRNLSKARKGSKSHLYIDGKGYERDSIRKAEMDRFEYRLWREKVFQRDDYTCQICKDKGGTLNADHIKPWSTHPELRYELDNGRTLCVSCHRKTDTWGKTEFGREIKI